MSSVASNIITITEEGATPTITLSSSVSSYGSQGGPVTLSGKTDFPDGTKISIYLTLVTSTGSILENNTNIGSATVSGGAFSFDYTIPSNDSTTYSLQYRFEAENSGTASPVVIVHVAEAAISISASTTSLTSSGGTVSFTGTSNYDSGVTLGVYVNGSQVTTTTTGSSGAFSFSLSFPADTSTQGVTYNVEVKGP